MRGSIPVSFEPNAIVDGNGPDFIVFENPDARGRYPAPCSRPDHRFHLAERREFRDRGVFDAA
jgi:hypothetical protein